MKELWIVNWEAASLIKNKATHFDIVWNFFLVCILSIEDFLNEFFKFAEMFWDETYNAVRPDSPIIKAI